MQPDTPPNKPPTRRKSEYTICIVVMLLAWVAVLFVTFATMRRYEFTPGADPAAPKSWPMQSQVTRPLGHSSLLVFAHPLCRCTDATLEELAKVARSAGPDIDITVLFFSPDGAGTEWRKSKSVQDAAATVSYTHLTLPTIYSV